MRMNEEFRGLSYELISEVQTCNEVIIEHLNVCS